jgi:hypothetical protein
MSFFFRNETHLTGDCSVNLGGWLNTEPVSSRSVFSQIPVH